ncbi:hypothetical protein F5Y19DRAFT_466245 [Xylariaceae sp. FL1651]|nr:hypothetical protein F5Y19DRAFT_466245 [Xylariaceae sp. FL1651]
MPEGYSRLASLMGTHKETAVFRRFGTLNALNLLYLQAELTNLENTLCQQAKADAESGHFERSIYARDWETLSESMAAENQHCPQWNTFLQVRKKLDTYNQTLYLQHLIAKMEPPNKRDFAFLQTWMKSPSMGNVYLLGADSHIWEEFDPAELLCIRPTKPDTWVAQVITNKLIQRYHHLVGRFFRTPEPSEMYKNTVQYSQESITRLGAVMGTALASLVPVGSIVVLYLIKSMTTRLVVIGIFTASFSMGLGIFTNGRMVEIFSATAALAAVQVVFVGSTASCAAS